MVKRVLVFAYGLASYLIFLVTFLYAIAFVGACPAVPSRLDGPLQTSLPLALAVDAALLTVFALQHSLMARRWFKEWWTQIVPWSMERSTFVLCASLALLLLFWQWQPIGVPIWSVESGVGRAALWTLFAAGWLTVLVVTFLINHFDLFGLRQVWLPLIGRPYTPVSFRTPLPYRYVRHPLYFGFLLAFWMTPTMTLAHLVFAVATTAYIVLAIQFEERDLVHEHGPAYEAYQRSVPMLIPGPRVALGKVAAATRRTTKGSTALALFLAIVLAPAAVRAQETDSDRSNAGAEMEAVLESTFRFQSVWVAEAEGYVLQPGCVFGPGAGAMSLLFVNRSFLMDDRMDSTFPEGLIYEPLPTGGVALVGVQYLVLADAWDATHAAPPRLMGQQFHVAGEPNRLRLPPLYTLPVWAWKATRAGLFAWEPATLSCPRDDLAGRGGDHQEDGAVHRGFSAAGGNSAANSRSVQLRQLAHPSPSLASPSARW
jgi:methanethiol S-methyltransferase